MLAYEATDFSIRFLSLGKESNLQIRSKRSTFLACKLKALVKNYNFGHDQKVSLSSILIEKNV